MCPKPAQLNAPSASKYSLIAQFAGAVMDNTKITAKPNPIEVSTFFEIDKNEHIPRKYAKTMLSMKIDFMNIFTNSCTFKLFRFY